MQAQSKLQNPHHYNTVAYQDSSPTHQLQQPEAF